MNFEWMEHIPVLQRIKARLALRHRLGYMLSWLPKLGLVSSPPRRGNGISVMMRLKNEARWVETAIRSLAPFVDQFSVVDNGSTDGTPEIVRRVADELSLNLTMEILPDADFGLVCDRSLANTTERWVLRWDGDMIARTDGPHSFAGLVRFAASLDPGRYWAVYFPHVRLEGDLSHQNPDYRLHHEEWLFTWSPAVTHRKTGRFRETLYPLYYRRIYDWTPRSFHLAGLDSAADMFIRSYWEEWRALDEGRETASVDEYARSRYRERYGDIPFDEAAALYARSRFRRLIPYDLARYGEYPALLVPFLDTFPQQIVARDGRITGRTDIMDILERVETRLLKTPVDVIVPTRNREDIACETVHRLLAEDYPCFRIIVCDQSDTSSGRISALAAQDGRLLYHTAASRGLPGGRNEALALATAEIVIFVDDDIIPDPGFIRGHILAYERPDIAGTVGRITESRPEMRVTVPEGKTGTVDWWRLRLYRGFTAPEPCEVDTVQGVNMSFRRKALEEAGGFDTGYGGPAYFEETDVSLGITARGYRLMYTPDTAVTHLGAASGGTRDRAITREVYWWGHNFARLHRKHFPAVTLPLWFSFWTAKFIRDTVRARRITPLTAGLKGVFDGWWNGGA